MEPHLHFPTCRLWVVPNYAHEWGYVRVTYLAISCSVSSGLRRRMLRQTAVAMLEECIARAGDKIEKNEMGWACGAYG